MSPDGDDTGAPFAATTLSKVSSSLAAKTSPASGNTHVPSQRTFLASRRACRAAVSGLSGGDTGNEWVLEIADSVARDKTTVSASGSGRDEDKMFCVGSRLVRDALASPALKDEHSESTDSDDTSSHVSASREERTTRDCDCDCENGAGGLFTFRAKDFDAR